jgi:hypothetical protein
MRRTYGQKTTNPPQSVKGGKQRHTNLVATGPDHGPTPGLQRIKTDGRIGSTTSPSYLKGGLTVDNNKSQQPHHGQIGGAAADHMSPGHKGGTHFSPRATKARDMAAAGRAKKARPHAEPYNAQGGPLRPVKPN